MKDYLDYQIDMNDREQVSVFDELSLWSARFGALLLNNIEIARNRDILDLGCANGFPLFELAHCSGDSCRIIGADIWAAAVTRAGWKKRLYQLANVDLVISNGAQLAFQDGCFDLVVSNLGVNNFADPAAVVAECYRVIKPGGKIALTTNLNGHMKEFYEVLHRVIIANGKTDALARLTENENHRGTKESVMALLEQGGFQITNTVSDQFTMKYADGKALFNHFLTKVGFLAGWRHVIGKEDEEKIFNQLETELNSLAHERGLALTVPMLFIEARKV